MEDTAPYYPLKKKSPFDREVFYDRLRALDFTEKQAEGLTVLMAETLTDIIENMNTEI